VTKSTILVATWGDGLFAVTGDGRTQEIANQPVRGLAPDGCGGALAIVGRHSLRRRAPGGEWATVATSEFELSCCMAVGDAIYVGTDDARMLRLSQGGVLDPIESFDTIAGRDTWFAGSAIINGQRLGPPLGIRSVAANSNGSILFANVHVGGIPRSIDGGRTWQPTIDINSDVYEVRAHPADPDIVAAASAIGLCISCKSLDLTSRTRPTNSRSSDSSPDPFWNCRNTQEKEENATTTKTEPDVLQSVGPDRLRDLQTARSSTDLRTLAATREQRGP